MKFSPERGKFDINSNHWITSYIHINSYEPIEINSIHSRYLPARTKEEIAAIIRTNEQPAQE